MNINNQKYFFIFFLSFVILGFLGYFFKEDFEFIKNSWVFEASLFLGLINMSLYVTLAIFFKEGFNEGKFLFFQYSVLMLCFFIAPILAKKFPW